MDVVHFFLLFVSPLKHHRWLPKFALLYSPPSKLIVPRAPPPPCAPHELNRTLSCRRDKARAIIFIGDINCVVVIDLVAVRAPQCCFLPSDACIVFLSTSWCSSACPFQLYHSSITGTMRRAGTRRHTHHCHRHLLFAQSPSPPACVVASR